LKVVSVRQSGLRIDQSEAGGLPRTGGCGKQSPTGSPDSDRRAAVHGYNREPDLQRAAILYDEEWSGVESQKGRGYRGGER